MLVRTREALEIIMENSNNPNLEKSDIFLSYDNDKIKYRCFRAGIKILDFNDGIFNLEFNSIEDKREYIDKQIISGFKSIYEILSYYVDINNNIVYILFIKKNIDYREYSGFYHQDYKALKYRVEEFYNIKQDIFELTKKQYALGHYIEIDKDIGNLND